MGIIDKNNLVSCLTQVECLSNMTRQDLHKGKLSEVLEKFKQIESHYGRMKEILERENKEIA